MLLAGLGSLAHRHGVLVRTSPAGATFSAHWQSRGSRIGTRGSGDGKPVPKPAGLICAGSVAMHFYILELHARAVTRRRRKPLAVAVPNRAGICVIVSGYGDVLSFRASYVVSTVAMKYQLLSLATGRPHQAGPTVPTWVAALPWSRVPAHRAGAHYHKQHDHTCGSGQSSAPRRPRRFCGPAASRASSGRFPDIRSKGRGAALRRLGGHLPPGAESRSRSHNPNIP